MTSTITTMGYKTIAQSCLDAYGNIYAEYGSSDEDLIRAAEALYREHGPFNLKFPNYAMDTPEWYE